MFTIDTFNRGSPLGEKSGLVLHEKDPVPILEHDACRRVPVVYDPVLFAQEALVSRLDGYRLVAITTRVDQRHPVLEAASVDSVFPGRGRRLFDGHTEGSMG
jgi:hypothetical protein